MTNKKTYTLALLAMIFSVTSLATEKQRLADIIVAEQKIVELQNSTAKNFEAAKKKFDDATRGLSERPHLEALKSLGDVSQNEAAATLLVSQWIDLLDAFAGIADNRQVKLHLVDFLTDTGAASAPDADTLINVLELNVTFINNTKTLSTIQLAAKIDALTKLSKQLLNEGGDLRKEFLLSLSQAKWETLGGTDVGALKKRGEAVLAETNDTELHTLRQIEAAHVKQYKMLAQNVRTFLAARDEMNNVDNYLNELKQSAATLAKLHAEVEQKVKANEGPHKRTDPR